VFLLVFDDTKKVREKHYLFERGKYY